MDDAVQNTIFIVSGKKGFYVYTLCGAASVKKVINKNGDVTVKSEETDFSKCIGKLRTEVNHPFPQILIASLGVTRCPCNVAIAFQRNGLLFPYLFDGRYAYLIRFSGRLGITVSTHF